VELCGLIIDKTDQQVHLIRDSSRLAQVNFEQGLQTSQAQAEFMSLRTTPDPCP